MFGYAPSFFYSQFLVTPPVPTTSCAGKTIIITGANTGLGREAARRYVQLGASKLIIGCRNLDKGRDAAEDIASSTGRDRSIIDVWPLDLTDYESVKKFADQTRELDRIDIVIENAGIHATKFHEVAGNESNITVNVISTFLLLCLLMPTLRKQKGNGITPTLTIVSSSLHFTTPFLEKNEANIFEALRDEKKTNMGMRYQTSKLLEVLALGGLAKQHPVEQLGVTINTVNPGWCHSELGRDMHSALFDVAKKIMCRTTEVGSRNLVDAGLRGPETHGKYLSDCQVEKRAPMVEGPGGDELQDRVWKELGVELEKIEPGVLNLLR
ncbi:short-chain dehydrogenase/reductase [Piedraia hortae CBS 480.64]|uniref:Short-chain dehydrogenase/reductase n=1 Tax=Piedraia hortae CBS 480.64 TaxID=1314780 RepID=A0A6A7C765_9PEZI|nr:short-chain dehydrogenase/reductase [Piedraia hortae CBS 480.64]